MTSQSDSRKILEELNFKKQQLQKGLVVSYRKLSFIFLQINELSLIR